MSLDVEQPESNKADNNANAIIYFIFHLLYLGPIHIISNDESALVDAFVEFFVSNDHDVALGVVVLFGPEQ